VIATGGSGRMYKTTSNAHTLTGDGIGMSSARDFRWKTWNFTSSPTGLAGLAS